MTYKSDREKKYYHENRDYFLNKQKNKREERRQVIFETLGGCCVQCGSTTSLEIDHINPLHKKSRQSVLSQGLSKTMTELDNLQLLCKVCHKVKSDAQRVAAYKLFFSLPLQEQEKLISQVQR